jgi:hypothetical protein
MSMIFKNDGTSSGVCPKCNTISVEKKGVLITWWVLGFLMSRLDTCYKKTDNSSKTPECNMLFRAEDEASTADQQTLSSPFLGNLLRFGKEGDEIEDTPGIFKRVIIRMIRSTTNFQHRSPSSIISNGVLFSEPEPSQTFMGAMSELPYDDNFKPDVGLYDWQQCNSQLFMSRVRQEEHNFGERTCVGKHQALVP